MKGMMRVKKGKSLCLAILSVFFIFSSGGDSLRGESIGQKSEILRLHLLRNLRDARVIVRNFPCTPFPSCLKGGETVESDLLKKYTELEKAYTEGMIYFYEGNFVGAYSSLFSILTGIDKLLDEMSQFYLERTSLMLRDALEKKDKENPDDKTVVSVLLDYGQKSRKREEFSKLHEPPHFKRSYDAKELRWVYNRHAIEGSVRKGYEYISHAREARLRASRVLSREQAPNYSAVSPELSKTATKDGDSVAKDRNDLVYEKKRKPVTFNQRKKRIYYYFKTIELCRQAKRNAGFIFGLKYPYDNYALQNPSGLSEKGLYKKVHKPSIEGVRMNWVENPFLYPGKLKPIFDLRVPARYRRDLVDVRNGEYDAEVDSFIRLSSNENKPESFEKISGQPEQERGGR